ncbi:hypothetical protein SAMN05661012_06332 [Chitinophaga sancti]|uniref:Uncharacterized protein n=1 Tax=Chitinophaga sancti TaxID=1004 RepID=A0A1K1SX62_9BACT|nr:hypothetical protein SAMN05661012_06332 [Chitinophaga sancti]
MISQKGLFQNLETALFVRVPDGEKKFMRFPGASFYLSPSDYTIPIAPIFSSCFILFLYLKY